MKVLIKIGGDCLNKGSYNPIGKNFSELYTLGVVPTIVHGGSSQIDNIMEERHIPLIKINGLRAVPDEPALDAVLEGLQKVNSGLVSAINEYIGSNTAVGLTNEEIIYAKKMPPVIDKNTGKLVDLGFVGEVKGINTKTIGSCLSQRKIPVLWCIGYGKDGQRYNVNADIVGENLAFGYDKYILLASVGGYIKDGKIVSEMTLEEAKKHNAYGGMSLKLDSVIRVLENTNLNSVQIASPDNLQSILFTDKKKGTMITKQRNPKT